MKTLAILLVLATAALGQEYGPFDLGTGSGSVTFDVATSRGTLLVTANSTGGGTGGRDYAYSEGRNGSSISGRGNERISYEGVDGTQLVAVYYWWVSLGEDGSWGYYDELKVYVRRTAPPPPTNRAPTIAWSAAPGNAAHGGGYFVAARGNDADGNLTQVNVWKDGVPFAFADGGDGSSREAGNWTSDDGPREVTFTAQAVDAEGATSALVTTVVTIAAPPPAIRSLTVDAGPGGTAGGGGNFVEGTVATVTATPDADHVFAGWSGDAAGMDNPLAVTLDRDKSVAANFALKRFSVSVSGGPGGAATGGGSFPAGSVIVVAAVPDGRHVFAGWTGDVGGSANPMNLTVTRDLAVTAHFTVRVFALGVSAGVGGSVAGGGAYPAGSTAVVTAIPDATYDFAGWSGDAGGIVNPVSVTMDRDRTIQASFRLKQFLLVTGAGGGGTVSPGGSYPAGAVVTLQATAAATHWFSGWSGDASGNANPLGVVMDRTKYVQANFQAKAGQTIAVEPLGPLAPGSAVTVRASASSGLPVSLSVVDGPGSLAGNVLTVTGPGTITVEATQAGDAFTLPASPVRISAAAGVAGVMRVRRNSRTLLGGESHFLIGNP